MIAAPESKEHLVSLCIPPHRLIYIQDIYTYHGKIATIFSPISANCLKEPSCWDGSFEYPQHMFRLRNKKNSLESHSLIFPCELNVFKKLEQF